MHLNQQLAQYINCMSSDSEFVAFVNHAIHMALDLTAFSNIWAVLLVMLETQDVNYMTYVQVMHNYYNECYNTKTEEYMIQLKQAAEKSKHNMYNNTLDEVSAHIWQSVHDQQMQPMDQQDVDAENHTHSPYHAHFNDILTEYPAGSTDTNDIENIGMAERYSSKDTRQ